MFLDKVPEEKDDFQWLALMQHHGAPTRLLDFTWSPFVAAFFALERATKDAVIWAVFLPSIWKRSYRLGGREVPGWELGLRNPGAYRRYYLNNEGPFVSVGEPMIMNKRLTVQSGTFLVPGVLDPPVDQILAEYPNPEKTVAKFILKTQSLRSEAMLALYSMNVTNATLFPDLDGLARSMAYELEFHYAYDPKEFRPNPGYEPDFEGLFRNSNP